MSSLHQLVETLLHLEMLGNRFLKKAGETC